VCSADRGQGVGAEGDDAFLLALAADMRASCDVEVVVVEADEFADADAGGVERLEHGAVAAAEHIGVAGCGEELLDLLDGDGLGQPLALARRADHGHGVGLGVGLAVGPLVEGPQGGDLAGHGGARRVVLLAEAGEEGADEVRVGLADVLSGGERDSHAACGGSSLVASAGHHRLAPGPSTPMADEAGGISGEPVPGVRRRW
jgi:hypothetical protein